MSASSRNPGSTVLLHGAPNSTGKDQVGTAASSTTTRTNTRTAIVVRLNSQVIRDLQQCSQAAKAVQLLGGKTPRIRYGAKLLELNVKPETFRHEIYSADDSHSHSHSQGDLGFAAFVSHCAHIKPPVEKKPQEDAASDDAALEALKQSLASMAKQKEDRKATISSSVVNNKSLRPVALHNRTLSSSSTPRSAAPTSAPFDPQATAKEKGMRFALVHLLAIKPATEQSIQQKTHIPKTQLLSLLPKFAETEGPRWVLSNKFYKELDPWNFRYSSEQRQTVIDNAIRAFDRVRIPKDDKVWQILLHEKERGKGKVLSRLHLTVDRKDQQIGTPGLVATPIHVAEVKPSSAAGTPKIAAVGTPRGAATATGRSAAGISIEKRLKDAKKKGALEKKKQEKEAKEAAVVASDRESKPRTMVKKAPPKKLPAKVKSDEIVHSSDDEEEGEVKETLKPTKAVDPPRKEPPKAASRPRPAPERRESSASEVSRSSKDSIQTKPKAKTLSAEKPTTGAATKKDSVISIPKSKAEPTKTTQTAASAKKSSENTAATKVSAKAKDTPLQKPVKPATAAQRPTQVSPKKPDTKPKVPSPLGASPPRNASTSTEKPAKSALSKPVKSAVPATSAKPVKVAKPDALDFFGGVKPASKSKITTKKRPMESDNDSSEPGRRIAKPHTTTTVKAATNGAAATNKKPTTNGITHSTKNGTANSTTKTSTAPPPPSRIANTNSDKSLKRKANELSSGLHDHAGPISKHRKTDSGSTHSHAPTNSSTTSLTTAPTISPAPTASPTHSDSSHDSNFAGILDDEYDGGTLTWEQARAAADWFRKRMYPEYLELYKRIERTPDGKVGEEEKTKLWSLHHRLEVVKQRIEVACGSGI